MNLYITTSFVEQVSVTPDLYGLRIVFALRLFILPNLNPSQPGVVTSKGQRGHSLIDMLRRCSVGATGIHMRRLGVKVLGMDSLSPPCEGSSFESA